MLAGLIIFRNRKHYSLSYKTFLTGTYQLNQQKMNTNFTTFLAIFIFSFGLTFQSASAQSISNPEVDLDVVEKIKEEGLERSQVMKMASWLTDVIGPRLTNSPQMYRANDWTKETLESFGLQNAHLHEWGPFGKGWELKRFAMHANSEHGYFPVLAYPKAWSPGFDGPVSGEVVYLRLDENTNLEDYRGKLEGKFVMIEEPVAAEPSWDPIGRRHDESSLLRLANATQRLVDPSPSTPSAAALARQRAVYERAQFLYEENPLAILDQSYRGWGGQIAISGATLPSEPGTPWTDRARPHEIDAPTPLTQISLAREHYGRIFRMIESGVPVVIELEMEVEFQTENLMAHNTIADIPGTDPDLADELVIIGAHLDSWHAGTGATDNASGSVVMMEAMRILSAIGVQPRRTIRIALWSGEEQGLWGSRYYVTDFVADVEGNIFTSQEVRKKEEYDKISAYFNVDNGTGQIRGIYLQQNEEVRQLFRTWLLPFADWGTETVSWSNTGGTDHLSFDRVGIPGFQFIQDPMEYFTLTHHSNMDTYERFVEQDLIRNAIIVAAFAYHTAMLDEKLPRKGNVEVIE